MRENLKVNKRIHNWEEKKTSQSTLSDGLELTPGEVDRETT